MNEQDERVERRDPERFVFPKWVAPIVSAGVIAFAAMSFNNQNKIIALERDLEFVKKELYETIARQRVIQSQLDRQISVGEDYHDKALRGINELVRNQKR